MLSAFYKQVPRKMFRIDNEVFYPEDIISLLDQINSSYNGPCYADDIEGIPESVQGKLTDMGYIEFKHTDHWQTIHLTEKGRQLRDDIIHNNYQFEHQEVNDDLF